MLVSVLTFQCMMPWYIHHLVLVATWYCYPYWHTEADADHDTSGPGPGSFQSPAPVNTTTGQLRHHDMVSELTFYYILWPTWHSFRPIIAHGYMRWGDCKSFVYLAAWLACTITRGVSPGVGVDRSKTYAQKFNVWLTFLENYERSGGESSPWLRRHPREEQNDIWGLQCEKPLTTVHSILYHGVGVDRNPGDNFVLRFFYRGKCALDLKKSETKNMTMVIVKRQEKQRLSEYNMFFFFLSSVVKFVAGDMPFPNVPSQIFSPTLKL